MSKQQTAVEWLEEKIGNKDMGEIPMWIYVYIEQAKEMEEKQIQDAWKDGNRKYTGYGDSETYYNEIFKEEE